VHTVDKKRFFRLFLDRIARTTYVIRPIVTERVAWSVGLSVCHTSEPCKKAELIEMPFGLRTLVGPGNHVLGSRSPTERGNFEGKRWVLL